jgi:hypothetical protein
MPIIGHLSGPSDGGREGDTAVLMGANLKDVCPLFRFPERCMSPFSLPFASLTAAGGPCIDKQVILPAWSLVASGKGDRDRTTRSFWKG